LAHHRLKKIAVVIKCFWETRHGSQDALFKEAFLMAEIAGEYVPKPLDCGFVDPRRQERGYFISEYIEGAIDGETWLAKHGKLDVQTGIAVDLQIAKCLQIAHDKGIFHLDLKPANILLQRQDEIVVKIIDFGLAKVAPSLGQEMATQRSRSGLSLLVQSAVFGTLDYAPPEQQGVTRYGEPNAKSDVYAFGKTLYRLLTGESPQTLHPRRLAKAPELFELLCDCVEIEPDRRVDLAGLIKGLMGLSPIFQPQPPQSKPIKQSQPPKPVETHERGKKEDQERIIRKSEKRGAKQKTVQPQKSVEKPIQPKQPRIVKIDKKRQWWNQLDDNWKWVFIFNKAININIEPSDSDLDRMVNLPELDFSVKTWKNKGKITNLEPLRALTNLRELNCGYNQIRDLEPLRALTNLQEFHCSGNQISALEPLRALTNLQELHCGANQISDFELLHALKKLRKFIFYGKIGWWKHRKLKKALPNCEFW
jgi:serine/threonine protein kinase